MSVTELAFVPTQRFSYENVTGGPSQPERPRKPRPSAIIVLATTSTLALVAAVVLGFIATSTKSDLAKSRKHVTSLQAQLSASQSEVAAKVGELSSVESQLSDAEARASTLDDQTATQKDTIAALRRCVIGVLNAGTDMSDGLYLSATSELQAVEDDCSRGAQDLDSLGASGNTA